MANEAKLKTDNEQTSHQEFSLDEITFGHDRKESRISVIYPLSLVRSGDQSQILHAQTINVSSSGFCCQPPVSFQENEEVNFKLGYNNTFLEGKASVAWIFKKPNQPAIIGFEITHFEQGKREFLSFLEKLLKQKISGIL